MGRPLLKYCKRGHECAVYRKGANRSCTLCRQLTTNRWKAANKETYRRWHQENKWKNTWGISREDYDKLLESQNGVCAICSGKCSRALAIDHDHKRGLIRGLLCGKCNRGIGLLQDSPEILRLAADYLENFNQNKGDSH